MIFLGKFNVSKKQFERISENDCIAIYVLVVIEENKMYNITNYLL